jgi:hypothetical protein
VAAVDGTAAEVVAYLRRLLPLPPWRVLPPLLQHLLLLL